MAQVTVAADADVVQYMEMFHKRTRASTSPTPAAWPPQCRSIDCDGRTGYGSCEFDSQLPSLHRAQFPEQSEPECRADSGR
jgi:hypothetical protein